MENVLFNEVLFSLLVFFGVSFFCLRYPDKVLAKILFFGFLVRAGLAYLQRFFVLLPDSTADATTFEARAWQAAEAWLVGADAGVNLSGSYQYSRLIAWLYSFLGRVPLAAQFINVLLGTFVIFLVFKTVFILFENKRAAYSAAIIAAFFPALNLYSAITMRETFIVFFFALSFYLFSHWLKKNNFRFILLSLSVIFISAIFHGGIFPIGLAYLFLFCFYYPRKKSWKIFSRQLVIGIILAIIYSSLFFGFFRTKVPNVFSIIRQRITYIVSSYREGLDDMVEAVEGADSRIEVTRKSPPGITCVLDRTSSRKVRGRAAYLEDMGTNNFFDVVWQTPVRIIYFYLTPFPWNIQNIGDFCGFIDVLLWLPLFIFSFKSLKLVKNQDKALFWAFLLIFIVFSATFAWGTSNYGTAFRHRSKIVFLMIVLASYFLGKQRGEKEQIDTDRKDRHR